jgi:predicted DNA-binding transcriptional regulator AlpA
MDMQTSSPIEAFDKYPNSAGVRLPTVTAVLACSNATVWRLAKSGVLKSVKVSPRVTVFNVGSIRAVLNGGA